MNRKLSDKRIYPAIDILKSGTRREDLLLTEDEMEAVFKLRRMNPNTNSAEFTEEVMDKIKKTKNNAEFVEMINKIK